MSSVSDEEYQELLRIRLEAKHDWESKGGSKTEYLNARAQVRKARKIRSAGVKSITDEAFFDSVDWQAPECQSASDNAYSTVWSEFPEVGNPFTENHKLAIARWLSVFRSTFEFLQEQ